MELKELYVVSTLYSYLLKKKLRVLCNNQINGKFDLDLGKMNDLLLVLVILFKKYYFLISI